MSSPRLAKTPRHRFAAEAVNGTAREWHRLPVASASFASAVVFSAENAGQFEAGEMLRHRMAGSSALAPAFEQGWRTYNFEVAGSHTYVAGGLRVHNRSILEFVEWNDFSRDKLNIDPETNDWDKTKFGFTEDENGIPREAWIERDSGIREIYIGKTYDGGTDTYLWQKITEYPQGGSEGGPSRIITEWVSRGDERNLTKVSVKTDPDGEGGEEGSTNSIVMDEEGKVVSGIIGGRSMLAADILGSIGSSIGGALGGNSFLGRIAGQTVVGTFGQSLGKFLQAGIGQGFSGSLLDGSTGGTSLIEGALTEAFGSFGDGLVVNGVSNLTSGVASLLMGELADSLGLDGFEGGLFSAASTSLINNTFGKFTSQLVQNAYGTLTGGTSGQIDFSKIFTGIDPASMFTSMSGSVTGYLGSYLASQIVSPINGQAAIGTQVGTAVGTAIASWALTSTAIGTSLVASLGLGATYGSMILGPIGTFIGAFIGALTGTLFGNALAPDPKSWHTNDANAATGNYELITAGAKNGGSVQTFMGLSTGVCQTINAIVDITGARLLDAAAFDLYQKGTSYTASLRFPDGAGEVYGFDDRSV
ncbi:MAG: hypothetical protein ACOVP3_02995, partial [Rhodoluna sp.]